MTSSHPAAASCQWFAELARPLDRRSAPRLALLFLGALLARGRRTVTTWIRAAGLGDRFRSCYTAVAAAGKDADSIAARLALDVVKPLVQGAGRLTLALDDTPTPRYGPHVQGAGVHHNPTPGPAGVALPLRTRLRRPRRARPAPVVADDRPAAAGPDVRPQEGPPGDRPRASAAVPDQARAGGRPADVGEEMAGPVEEADLGLSWPTGPTPRRTSSSRRPRWG